MNNQKIAILADSGLDVPADFVAKHDIYVVPLKLLFGDTEYYDRVTLTPEQAYEMIDTQYPKTSLPSAAEITAVLDKIKSDGFEKVLGIFISSGLSGTFNIARICMEEYEGLECYAVDTKNIAIAAGFNAMQAAAYIEQGMPWEELKRTVENNIGNSKVFFSLATLDYLQKGGRIGLVASVAGKMIDFKPVISCNDDGIYYVAGKSIGRKKSLEKAKSLIQNFGKDAVKYNLAVMYGGNVPEIEQIKADVMRMFPNPQYFTEGQISPILGVHTGPGLVGIALQII
ncbi:MAG: DegV family protein [Oscillospiraceae bacterium]|nr:DegV family protein [Oscillospiraceae bacterium]